MAPFEQLPDAETMRKYSLYGELVSDTYRAEPRKKSAIDIKISKIFAQTDTQREPLRTNWKSQVQHQLWINASAEYLLLTGPQAGLPSSIDSQVFADLGWCRRGAVFKLLTRELFLRVQAQLDAAPLKNMPLDERQRWSDWYDVILEFAACEGWFDPECN